MFERFRTARERPPAPAPLAALPRPLAECRLALVVSSVCLVPRGRGVGRNVPLGDPSIREVAADFVSTGTRAAADASAADASAANLDRNLAMAFDRLREAVAGGRLGELSGRHFALGGAMAATDGAVRARASVAARRLLADRVDVALLVPT